MTQLEEWSLTDEQRQETIQRMQANISAMAFFRNTPIAGEAVAAAAVAIEKKAYTVARVEARTTTGVRPHHETLKVLLAGQWGRAALHGGCVRAQPPHVGGMWRSGWAHRPCTVQTAADLVA